MKRLVIGLVALGATAIIWVQYRRGSAIEACATRLANADANQVAEMTDNASVREALLEADEVELEFARPFSPEWSRVGFRLSRTATTPRVLVLLLSNEALPECRFLRDYEKGAFGP